MALQAGNLWVFDGLDGNASLYGSQLVIPAHIDSKTLDFVAGNGSGNFILSVYID